MPVVFRHVSETSLVGLLVDAKNERRTFQLEPHHGVIILSRCIRSLNAMKVQTIEEFSCRRETCALLTGLRLQISREALRGELP
ncbi:MAG: hypothetical protein WA817_16525 [Candidatus Acidiferrum sp.]